MAAEIETILASLIKPACRNGRLLVDNLGAAWRSNLVFQLVYFRVTADNQPHPGNRLFSFPV
jgi:hypothetical protein